MQTRPPMRRGLERGHTFTLLFTSLLVLLAACPNGTNGDNLKSIPETVALTGYSDIQILKDTPIDAQTPTLTNLPTEEGITFTYSINPELPAGLTLNPTTGELNGIPTTPQAAANYTIIATPQGHYSGTVESTISIGVVSRQVV